jgi:hypothetical protein
VGFGGLEWAHCPANCPATVKWSHVQVAKGRPLDLMRKVGEFREYYNASEPGMAVLSTISNGPVKQLCDSRNSMFRRVARGDGPRRQLLAWSRGRSTGFRDPDGCALCDSGPPKHLRSRAKVQRIGYVGLLLTCDTVASYSKYSIWPMASRASVSDSRQTATRRNNRPAKDLVARHVSFL